MITEGSFMGDYALGYGCAYRGKGYAQGYYVLCILESFFASAKLRLKYINHITRKLDIIEKFFFRLLYRNIHFLRTKCCRLALRSLCFVRL